MFHSQRYQMKISVFCTKCKWLNRNAFCEHPLVVPHAAVNVGVVRRDVDDDEGPEVLVCRLSQRLPRPIQINGGLHLVCKA